jgi:hypothetical protein
MHNEIRQGICFAMVGPATAMRQNQFAPSRQIYPEAVEPARRCNEPVADRLVRDPIDSPVADVGIPGHEAVQRPQQTQQGIISIKIRDHSKLRPRQRPPRRQEHSKHCARLGESLPVRKPGLGAVVIKAGQRAW